MKKLTQGFLAACWLALVSSGAQAHFIWIAPEPSENPQTVKVYLSEEALPDDPALLEGIVKSEAWVVADRGDQPEPLPLKLEGNALVGKLPEDTTTPIILKHVYGVSETPRGSYLLNYYAKAYPSMLPGNWTAVNDPQRLPLEIMPQLDGTKFTFKVLWKGEAKPGCQVTVVGPGIEEHLQGDTDANGVYTCELKDRGIYSIRARLIEPTSGELNGKAYPETRHYSTVALNFAPSPLKPATHQWPALDKGITSFGGAIAGNHLYVYGGHFGQAHHYSHEGQSGEFRRLDLANPTKWEALPGGPKLTGLAMVAHQGKIYRMGGFTAKNSNSEEESLWSQSDFARFDPAKGAWEALAPLPEGRSSHDAAVVGDTLYVVGGWEMKAGSDSKWHKTAWSCDLTQANPVWTALPEVPFERRAVAAAGFNNKLYVIGGMQSSNGTTTAVAIYDPATKAWSEGPRLQGTGMDGFGSAAMACDGVLYVSTMSGSVQRLSADGSKWEFVSQLEHPRFFHRVLQRNHELVFVGGASMQTGKITELERLPLAVSAAGK